MNRCVAVASVSLTQTEAQLHCWEATTTRSSVLCSGVNGGGEASDHNFYRVRSSVHKIWRQLAVRWQEVATTQPGSATTIVVMMVGMKKLMRKMMRTWRRCRGDNGPECETIHSGELWRCAMARRTRHKIWWFIRRGGGRVDGMKVGGQLGVMEKEKRASAGETKKKVTASGQPCVEKENKVRNKRTS